MSIQWDVFTPVHALAGGALIGAAAGLLALGNGRVAGISGILGGILGNQGERAWRVLFMAGLLVAAPFYRWVAAYPPATVTANVPLLVVAGLLVGVGTRVGSGCTSGHGVCGIARGSVRSVAATVAFMLAGIATVFIVRHVIGA